MASMQDECYLPLNDGYNQLLELLKAGGATTKEIKEQLFLRCIGVAEELSGENSDINKSECSDAALKGGGGAIKCVSVNALIYKADTLRYQSSGKYRTCDILSSNTLLHLMAMQLDSLSLFEMMVDKTFFKANINVLDHEGKTPLFRVLSAGHSTVLELKKILKLGADAKVIDKHSRTVLIELLENTDQPELCQKLNLLIEHGADVNVKCADHNSVLHLALESLCQQQQPELIEVINALIDHDANIHATNKNGSTPLHLACRLTDEHMLPIVTRLCELEANVSALNTENRTPIMMIGDDYKELTDAQIKLILYLYGRGGLSEHTTFNFKISAVHHNKSCKNNDQRLKVAKLYFRHNDCNRGGLRLLHLIQDHKISPANAIDCIHEIPSIKLRIHFLQFMLSEIPKRNDRRGFNPETERRLNRLCERSIFTVNQLRSYSRVFVQGHRQGSNVLNNAPIEILCWLAAILVRDNSRFALTPVFMSLENAMHIARLFFCSPGKEAEEHQYLSDSISRK